MKWISNRWVHLVFFVVLAMIAMTATYAKKRGKSLYTLPAGESATSTKKVTKKAAVQSTAPDSTFLVGTAEGLFRVTEDNIASPLWTMGAVEQIIEVTQKLKAPLPDNKDSTDPSSQNNLDNKVNDEVVRSDLENDSSNTNDSAIESESAAVASNLTTTTTTKIERTAWYFRTSSGVLYSSDLNNFELRNEGLPFLTIKHYNKDVVTDDNNGITFTKEIHTLKDLCVDPFDSNNIITATKDCVYLSRDGGLSWKSIGSMSNNTSGLKAVAITTIKGRPANEKSKAVPDELVAFMSHPIFGLAYMRLSTAHPAWIDVSGGLDLMNTMTQTDEIADILPIKCLDSSGVERTRIFMSQTFIPRIYEFDWGERRANRLYKGAEANGTIDGLTMVGDNILYSTIEGLGSLNPDTQKSPGTPERLDEWKKAFSSAGSWARPKVIQDGQSDSSEISNSEIDPAIPNCAWVGKGRSGFNQSLSLNELWLLFPGTINTRFAARANGVKCVYASAYQCRLQSGIDKFKKILRDNKLNGLVIDMKDDYGLLRYETEDPYVKSMGKVTQYKIDIDHFVSEFKKDGVYLVARVVVFKDRNLANFGGSRYSIWNAKTNEPWRGIKAYEDITDEEGVVVNKTPVYYDEKWVDPYCPVVWEYNTAIAKELVARGFDEVQFDYIRFPTDGLNLGSCQYRWKSPGMDKEAALISFLSYARSNIKAPIGIDIYGANGWYRSGTRTGQDVEMLSQFVDVIGPMFYPSHFEQGFLDEAPFADRTYRIYYYGTYRNTVMARNRVIVRPWVQAFYLNVRYDRQYYNKDYVIKQVYGVRDSVDRGYMYWNNGGNYDTISPDVGPEDEYIGTTPESQNSRPSIGKERACLERTVRTPKLPVDEKFSTLPEHSILSALDSIYFSKRKDTNKTATEDLSATWVKVE